MQRLLHLPDNRQRHNAFSAKHFSAASLGPRYLPAALRRKRLAHLASRISLCTYIKIYQFVLSSLLAPPYFDCKTCHRLPSDASPRYQDQGICKAGKSNDEARLYVAPTDFEQGLTIFKAASCRTRPFGRHPLRPHYAARRI